MSVQSRDAVYVVVFCVCVFVCEWECMYVCVCVCVCVCALLGTFLFTYQHYTTSSWPRPCCWRSFLLLQSVLKNCVLSSVVFHFEIVVVFLFFFIALVFSFFNCSCAVGTCAALLGHVRVAHWQTNNPTLQSQGPSSWAVSGQERSDQLHNTGRTRQASYIELSRFGP